MRMREVLRVGASVASIVALALKVADTPTWKEKSFCLFCCYPTLCVWGKHSARTSTADGSGVLCNHTAEIGGSHRAVAATVPRQFGQKPGGEAAPTLFCKEIFTKVKVIDWEERKPK